MDPNAALATLRRLAQRVVRDGERGGPGPDALDAAALAHAVLAMDGWLCRGGFPPAEWDPDLSVTPPVVPGPIKAE